MKQLRLFSIIYFSRALGRGWKKSRDF